MTEDKKKVKLVADDVNAADRYVFNRAAALRDESRGEVLSKLLREFAERTFGGEAVAAMKAEFEKREQRKAGDETTRPHPDTHSAKPSGLD